MQVQDSLRLLPPHELENPCPPLTGIQEETSNEPLEQELTQQGRAQQRPTLQEGSDGEKSGESDDELLTSSWVWKYFKGCGNNAVQCMLCNQ